MTDGYIHMLQDHWARAQAGGNVRAVMLSGSPSMSRSTATDRPLRIGLLALTVITLTFTTRGGAQATDAPSVTRAAHAAHLDRMLRAEDLKQALLEAADANQTNAILQNARNLKPLLTAEHVYWTSAGDARALSLSSQNQQALDQLIATASQGNTDRAYNSALAFAASCSACHDNHPEQRVRVRN